MKIILRLFVILASIAACYCSIDYQNGQFTSFLVLYFSGMLYHLLIDKKRNTLFLVVFALFSVSSLFGIVLTNIQLDIETSSTIYVLTVQVFWLLGFFVIFLKMLKDHPIQKIRFNKWIFLVVAILIADVFLGTQILGFVETYDLSVKHIVYAFAYTFLKMILLSIGLVLAIVSSKGTTKSWFLLGVLFCFFFSDLIATYNGILFFENQIAALTILDTGLYCIGLVLFYFYCISPNTNINFSKINSKTNQEEAKENYINTLFLTK